MGTCSRTNLYDFLPSKHVLRTAKQNVWMRGCKCQGTWRSGITGERRSVLLYFFSCACVCLSYIVGCNSHESREQFMYGFLLCSFANIISGLEPHVHVLMSPKIAETISSFSLSLPAAKEVLFCMIIWFFMDIVRLLKVSLSFDKRPKIQSPSRTSCLGELHQYMCGVIFVVKLNRQIKYD